MKGRILQISPSRFSGLCFGKKDPCSRRCIDDLHVKSYDDNYLFSCETSIPLVFWTLPNRRVRLALPLNTAELPGEPATQKFAFYFKPLFYPVSPIQTHF